MSQREFNQAYLIQEFDDIKEYIKKRSSVMCKYMDKHNKSLFYLWHKNLFHSDLLTRGKRKGTEPLDKNYLYYLTVEEMEQLEKRKGSSLPSAKQSNIHLPIEFYEQIGVRVLERRVGKQAKKHESVIISDAVNVYLVNETLEYFTYEYTKKVLDELKKPTKWDHLDCKPILSTGDFTKIRLSEAIHGIGTSDDVEFHKLRHNMFLYDTIILLIEKSGDTTNLFILLEKNPRFFSILHLANKHWEKYLEASRKEEVNRTIAMTPLEEEEKTRARQQAWKDRLAHEMMTFSPIEGHVFCPLTLISAPYEQFKMLFIGSHIKRFADSDVKEAYDINNGLLLYAGVDALFDKYMITIDENKKVVFSFLLEKDMLLRQKLYLNQSLFEPLLNESRMKYLEDHRKIFYEKEEKRKKGMADD